MIKKHKRNNVRQKIKRLPMKTKSGGKLKNTENKTERNETDSKAGRRVENPKRKNRFKLAKISSRTKSTNQS